MSSALDNTAERFAAWLEEQLSSDSPPQNILIMDEHTQFAPREILAHPTVQDVMAAYDSALIIEGPQLYNDKVVEPLQQGTLSEERLYQYTQAPYHEADPEANERWESAFRSLLVNAVERDIPIRFPDEGYDPLRENPTLGAYLYGMSRSTTSHACTPYQLATFESTYDPETLQAVQQGMFELLQNRTGADNTSIATNIEAFAPEGPRIILYGAAHANELRQQLSGEMVRVAFVETPDGESLTSRLGPDLIVDTVTGELHTPAPETSREIQNQSVERQMANAYLHPTEPADYRECVAAMPEDIQQAAAATGEFSELLNQFEQANLLELQSQIEQAQFEAEIEAAEAADAAYDAWLLEVENYISQAHQWEEATGQQFDWARFREVTGLDYDPSTPSLMDIIDEQGTNVEQEALGDFSAPSVGQNTTQDPGRFF